MKVASREKRRLRPRAPPLVKAIRQLVARRGERADQGGASIDASAQWQSAVTPNSRFPDSLGLHLASESRSGRVGYLTALCHTANQ